ncbi:ATP phosphoribosyltransferase regulatory subunit [Scopulibacillus cellulosilyticus]|uniref:ATP phosphoribosyltransferase regulatory subunit n=1 Tax=Scopulibacillus cellulosilyticus TaxID=2665665 RepID=A0ABW2Q323_9BACL
MIILSDLYMFEKPLGMRDTLPSVYRTIQKIKNIYNKEIEKWGYEFMATPALEYEATIGKVSATVDHHLFRLLDKEGRTVVLRPDMTAPIARVAASSLKKQPLPLRLAYTSTLFRTQQFEGGRPAEFEQAGVELIGDATAHADAEVIALMIRLLKMSGLKDVKIVIGHTGYVNALLSDIIDSPDDESALRWFLYKKNDVGFREHVQSLKITQENKRRLLTFIDSRRDSNQNTLEKIKELLPNSYGLTIYQHISQLYHLLKHYGVSECIDLDLTLISHLDYYTGVVFEGYGGSKGFAISSGGRYDELLGKFNRPLPATGFGLRLDRLIETLDLVQDDHQNNKTVVIYSDANQEQALKYAQDMREQGHPVVLQAEQGLKDSERFLNHFNSVIDFTS